MLPNIGDRPISLQKCFIDMEKSFSKATLVLLFLSISVAAIIMPIAKAQSMSVTFTRSEGNVRTQVIVEITNFPSTNYFRFQLAFLARQTLNNRYRSCV